MYDQYEKLAKKALDILEIKYEEETELDELVRLLETAFSLVGSKTEAEIHRIVRILAKKLRDKEDIEEIKKIIK